MDRALQLPKTVYLIIANEFCERFCYYGMRTILILYLTDFLFMRANVATSVFHSFVFLCHFAPIVGAVLADGVLGRFKTISILSFVYLLGISLLSLTALPPLGAPLISAAMVSLFLIALGTGGIKPCVSAFGADQISLTDTKLLDAYFAMFYLSVNLGSLLSTIISPVLRADITCFDKDCYGVAFGLMAILMLISIIIFLSGSKHYKKASPLGNVIGDFFGCIFTALKRLLRRQKYSDDWLELASPEYDKSHIDQVRTVLNIFFIYIPLPIFWALFDQMGSTWTLQAMRMDGSMGDFYTMKPDQMQAWNSFLIILFVPLFEVVIYPLLGKINVLTKPLDRMTWGIAFASASFFCAGILQIFIQKGIHATSQSNITIANVDRFDLQFRYENHPINLEYMQDITLKMEGFDEPTVFQSADRYVTISGTLAAGSYVFYGNSDHLSYLKLEYEHIVTAHSGKARIRFVKIGNNRVESIVLNHRGTKYPIILNGQLNVTQYLTLEPDIYGIISNIWTSSKSLRLRNGATYCAVIVIGDNSNEANILLMEESSSSSVNMNWQLFQYVLITIAETLFAVTGMQFSYAQAPATMKSVVSAGWILNIAVGNVIVVVVANSHLFRNQALQFFFFAALMLLAGVLFWSLSKFYKYRTPETLLFEEDVDKREEIPEAINE